MCVQNDEEGDRGKRSRTLNEEKSVKNVYKNPERFLMVSLVQKNPFGLKEDNPSQRNCQNQLSRISLVIEESHYCSHKEQ